MSEDFERRTARTQADEAGALTGEDPLAGGDLTHRETGYQTGSAGDDPDEAAGLAGGSGLSSPSSGSAAYVSDADGSTSSTTDVAKEQGQQVGQEAVAGGQQVVGVAADQAKNVVSEAGT